MRVEIVSTGLQIKEEIKTQLSKKYYRMLKRSNVKYSCNDILLRSFDIVNCGDIIVIEFEPTLQKQELEYDMKLDILFECDDYMVVIKPPHLNTIPSKAEPSRSLYNAIYTYLKKKNKLNTIHIITRLDKETSGLVLVALNKETALFMNKNHNKMNKIYYTRVNGIVDKSHFVVTKAIKKDDTSMKRIISEEGCFAKTEFWVVTKEKNSTILKAKLYTGKTHQIRLHLASVGFPVLGDSLYGTEEAEQMFLHCGLINFYTKEGKKVEYENKPNWIGDIDEEI